MNWDSEEIIGFLDGALQEDIGSGDITSGALFPENPKIKAYFLAKQDGVIAGLPVLERIFRRLDAEARVLLTAQDGQEVRSGMRLAEVQGKAIAILSAERLALNLLQRLSGIATQTSFFARLARPLGIAILDTRKTTPLLRALEKYAVRTGGGKNHRFGLFDGVLVKDNHLQLEPDFFRILQRFREKGIPPEAVEVEVSSLAMFEHAFAAGVVWFLLDNFTPDMVRWCVTRKQPAVRLEVSGGINRENFREYLIPGVDAISIGGLTHSARSLDISMEIEGRIP